MTCAGRLLNDLSIRRGQNKTYKLTVKNPDGTPVALGVGSAVYLAVKRRVEDENPVIKKSSEAGSTQAEITDPANGIAKFYLVPADTQNVPVGRYVYDCWVKLASGKRYPVVEEAAFEVEWNVVVITS